MVTKDEFEAAYAEHSRIPLQVLHSWGLYAEPCHCGDETCGGWAMDWEHRRERASMTDDEVVRSYQELNDDHGA